jgi:hypothetical protein
MGNRQMHFNSSTLLEYNKVEGGYEKYKNQVLYKNEILIKSGILKDLVFKSHKFEYRENSNNSSAKKYIYRKQSSLQEKKFFHKTKL